MDSFDHYILKCEDYLCDLKESGFRETFMMKTWLQKIEE